MRGMTALALAACGLQGCRAAGPATPAEIEARLQSDARSVVRDPFVTLYSPYDEVATGSYVEVVRHQAELVRSLLHAPAEPPVRLYLVPAPEPDEPWKAADRGGAGGGAFHEGFAFAYVRQEAGAAWLHASIASTTLRHELAHVYAHRAGLARAKWFDEGLARTIETMTERGGELRAHPFPPALVAARAKAGPGSLARLLAWTMAHPRGADELAPLYDLGQAFVCFLLERAPGSSWRERVQAVRELPDADVQASEPEWLAWLGGLDALAVLRERARSADPDERGEAAALLPILAERRAEELATRAADELALALLADPATVSGASTFLVYFRAQALEAADLAALEGQGDPLQLLIACALRARREEPLDLEAARAAWSRLTELERLSCSAFAALFPELDG